MIIFDIDDTISPTQPGNNWAVLHETKKAWGFNISIPVYVLDFLRSRDDIALLSTWGEAAKYVPEAFGFTARILVMDSRASGIKGKFETVKQFDDATVWIDDHITPAMKKFMAEKGILTIKPTKGVISEQQLAAVIAQVQQS
jgi:hypothetical protein